MYKIYKIVCLVNKKVYIGQTSRMVDQRFQEHKRDVIKGRDNTLFHKAMRKHGLSNFIVEEIDKCETQEDAHQLEIKWIKFYRSNRSKYPNGLGYNLTDGGEGANGYIGKPHSEEHKKYLRKINLGRKHSSEAKEKISLSKVGKKRSPKTIEKMKTFKPGNVPWNKGTSMSEEQKLKLSQSRIGQSSWNKGIRMSDSARNNMKNAQLGKKQSTEVKYNRKLTWLVNGIVKVSASLNIDILIPRDHSIINTIIEYIFQFDLDSKVKRKLKRLQKQNIQLDNEVNE